MELLPYLGNAGIEALDSLYQHYLENPAAVPNEWRRFFEGFQFAQSSANGHTVSARAAEPGTTVGEREIAVLNLINAYRMRGHLFTRTNPVRERRHYRPTLDLENFGLSDQDLETVYASGCELGLGPTTLREILECLQQTYCRSIGAEYQYIHDPETVRWWQTTMESTRNRPRFSRDAQHQILRKLAEAVLLEHFLHGKFVGQKRFSLEGVEAAIPALDALIDRGSALGVQEFVIGMAHRGRLNVLANILGKSFEQIVAEFKGNGFEDTSFDGDVKYHLGYCNHYTLPNGRRVQLTLLPNPSHLEAVDPVVEGTVRARLDHGYGGNSDAICPVLLHGDASIAGQGVVYEVLQMSQLDGYGTGGTIHLVLNNQLGFTTHYLDGRSSTYCTDVAKVTRSPVLHVNADDVEAVVFTMHLAIAYRQKFHRDVFIDLLGYRKHGHNEGDEPRFTQPVLYKLIEQHAHPLAIYREQLQQGGEWTAADLDAVEQACRERLDRAFARAKETPTVGPHGLTPVAPWEEASPEHDAPRAEEGWEGMRTPTDAEVAQSPDTGVADGRLRALGEAMLTIPPDVTPFRKIEKLFEDRRRLLHDGERLDWALGEWLAYATLLDEGIGVRISGQDCERGTFSHRHAVITVKDSEEEFVPLRHLHEGQGPFEIYNSPLSEYGVLGFEYGYALASPQTLVIWEAQFGDFMNGAQIIIDQYLAAAETKWQRMNGLVLFLPHGHEGQGPEHSSARVERFLTLCADNYLQVANCTTPANFFHLLRRQMHRDFRRPLVVFTPKSLLRHPQCVSPLDDFARGGFREVIDDATDDPRRIRRVLCCSGKIYYELLAYRTEYARHEVAIVRLEQLSPFPRCQLDRLVQRYQAAETWSWVQEEPINMGAAAFLQREWGGMPLTMVARRGRASPATGFPSHHAQQQIAVIQEAFT
ncbi:MAG: 2-oxoglutarate dehydrogenase E1 component [Deltaproteobacteria bacterium]|nr:2-oxoglutarate dehydrogenase E1 component [Deltaproteobacteria bacterium]